MSRQSPFSPNNTAEAPGLAAAVTKDRQTLLGCLRERRMELHMAQGALADALGISRMSVARAERPDADLQLSTFLAMARGLGLSVSVKPLGRASTEKKPVHQGLAHNRVATAELRKFNAVEAAMAKSWGAANEHSPQLPGLMHQLIPGFNARDAEVAATVVQWLGSEVGMAFLTKAMSDAGYVLQPAKTGAAVPA